MELKSGLAGSSYKLSFPTAAGSESRHSLAGLRGASRPRSNTDECRSRSGHNEGGPQGSRGLSQAARDRGISRTFGYSDLNTMAFPVTEEQTDCPESNGTTLKELACQGKTSTR